MNEPEEIFPERKATTYSTHKRTRKELRIAVIRPKRMEKVGKRNHLPVVVRSTREKDDRLRCQRHICNRRSYGVTSCMTFFLPRSGTALFSFFLDAL